MALKRQLIWLAITTFFMATAAEARSAPLQPGLNLTARLEANGSGNGGGGIVACWNALTEIKSCSNEIVLFFMNGATDIGPACCNAISMITHHCWPAMLTTLGFTPEECSVLRGYCDATSSGGPAPSPAAQPQTAAETSSISMV